MAAVEVAVLLKELELELEELEMGAEVMEGQTQQEAMEPQIEAAVVAVGQRKRKMPQKMVVQVVLVL